MIELPAETWAQIHAHAAKEFPREACGLIVVRHGRRQYQPCRNIAQQGADFFELAPEDYAAAEESGGVFAVVHTHPNASANPSEADRVECERSGLPWLIVGWPSAAAHYMEPSGYAAPLVGRPFIYGVLDCYTLARDYYARECGWELPQLSYPPKWWETGANLYVEGYAAAGFVAVQGPPQKHDALLMRIASPVPNHAAVFLGGNKILHHIQGRVSTREVFGGWYRRAHTHTLRHQSLA